MLGLGNWEFTVDSMLFRGKVKVAVTNEDGAYDVKLDIPGMDKIPPIVIVSIEEKENELCGIAKNSALGDKDIPFSFSFDGEKATGFIKIPIVGKINLKDGRMID